MAPIFGAIFYRHMAVGLTSNPRSRIGLFRQKDFIGSMRDGKEKDLWNHHANFGV